MSHPDQHEPTHEAFHTFIGRLDAHPDRAELISRLEQGHTADAEGWCIHPLHTLADLPERHPCTTTQLATAIRRATDKPIPP